MNRKLMLRLIRFFVIAIFSLAFLFPFAWMIISSLKSPTKVFVDPIEWFPKSLRWANYTKLFTRYEFHKYIWNTVMLCGLNVLGTAISCTLVAYGFAFSKWRHKNKVFTLVLMTMMLPGSVIFFPQFILFVKLKMYGTLLPLWLVSFFGNAYYIFFLRQYYLTIPKELVNAAKMDGATNLKLLWHIIIPMSRPAYIVMIMSTFISVWGDFFNQLIYITKPSQKTIMLGLDRMRHSYGTSGNSTLPSIMAASFLISIPILLVYYFGQRAMFKTYVFREQEK